MDTILKVKLWGNDVAAVVWDKKNETGVIEFYDSFINLGLDIAPLTMPLEDMARGERIFQFPAQSMGIKPAKEIIKQTVDVVSLWSKYAKEVDVNIEHINKIGQTHRMSIASQR